jgi:TolA-binding protein
VYALVVERYPTDERAPTALYKRATAMRVTGRTADAQVLYKQLVDKYPRSDEAMLAEGFLGTRKP